MDARGRGCASSGGAGIVDRGSVVGGGGYAEGLESESLVGRLGRVNERSAGTNHNGRYVDGSCWSKAWIYTV